MCFIHQILKNAYQLNAWNVSPGSFSINQAAGILLIHTIHGRDKNWCQNVLPFRSLSRPINECLCHQTFVHDSLASMSDLIGKIAHRQPSLGRRKLKFRSHLNRSYIARKKGLFFVRLSSTAQMNLLTLQFVMCCDGFCVSILIDSFFISSSEQFCCFFRNGLRWIPDRMFAPM